MAALYWSSSFVASKSLVLFAWPDCQSSKQEYIYVGFSIYTFKAGTQDLPLRLLGPPLLLGSHVHPALEETWT